MDLPTFMPGQSNEQLNRVQTGNRGEHFIIVDSVITHIHVTISVLETVASDTRLVLLVRHA
jgi:hypothetical protein